MTDALAQIESSLEAAAEAGDPVGPVYARLFAGRPELEGLFVLGEQAKGHMLDEAFRLVLDLAGPRTYAPGFLKAEVVNHEQLGVEPDAFLTFLPLVRDVVAEMAGPAWTPAMADALAAALAEAEGLLARTHVIG
jgi:hemoglobin-like flavoprotein